MVVDVALITEYHLLPFAAGGIRADRVERTSAISLYDIQVASRPNSIVVGKIDGSDVDRVADIFASIAC